MQQAVTAEVAAVDLAEIAAVETVAETETQEPLRALRTLVLLHCRVTPMDRLPLPAAMAEIVAAMAAETIAMAETVAETEMETQVPLRQQRTLMQLLTTAQLQTTPLDQ
jgi:hypothetical protein